MDNGTDGGPQSLLSCSFVPGCAPLPRETLGLHTNPLAHPVLNMCEALVHLRYTLDLPGEFTKVAITA